MRRLLVLLALPLVASACSTFGTAPAATIEGTEISVDEIEEELEAILSNDDYTAALEQSYGSPVEGAGGEGTFNAAMTAQLLTIRVYVAAVENDLERRGVEIDDDVLADIEESTRAGFDAQFGEGAFDGFPESYRQSIVRQQAVVDVVQRDIEGSLGDDERDFYENNPDEFATVCISHILVGVQDGRTPAEAQAEAEELYERIQDGEDFETLAAEESDDAAAAAGDGFLDCGSKIQLQFDPVFEKAAFELDNNEISEPVQTQFGSHIIMVKGREVPSFDEVESTIGVVMQEALTTRVNDYFIDVFCSADVDVNPRYGTWTVESCEGIAPQSPSVRPPEGPVVPASDAPGFDQLTP